MKQMNGKKGFPPVEAPDDGETPTVEASEAPDDATSSAPKKNWIAGAIKKPGALHAEMGVPAGQKIPSDKLSAAAKSKGLLGKRARLAMILSKFKAH